MTKIEKAVQQMEAWARDNSHGYDQIYRWGEKGDYDCSAAVIQAYENAGVPVKSNGATYTGNMLPVFKRCGFIDVTNKINLATGAGLVRGDVLLNTVHHTALYCGNGLEVEASINEKGTATGGKPGDQTGMEFLIRGYRNYPWTNVLRYQEAAAQPVHPASTTVKFIGEVTADKVNVRSGAGTAYGTVPAWPQLGKGNMVEVCDTVKGTDGNWYYVRIAGKVYGYVYSSYIKQITGTLGGNSGSNPTTPPSQPEKETEPTQQPEEPKKINATVQPNTGEDYQRLIFEDAENGQHRIKDKANGFYLTAAGTNPEDNAEFRPADGSDSQLWNIEKKQYGYADYTMFKSAVAEGLYLSVENNGQEGKNNLKLYTDLHNQKQKFYIREETDGCKLAIHVFSGMCVSAKS